MASGCSRPEPQAQGGRRGVSVDAQQRVNQRGFDVRFTSRYLVGFHGLAGSNYWCWRLPPNRSFDIALYHPGGVVAAVSGGDPLLSRRIEVGQRPTLTPLRPRIRGIHLRAPLESTVCVGAIPEERCHDTPENWFSGQRRPRLRHRSTSIPQGHTCSGSQRPVLPNQVATQGTAWIRTPILSDPGPLRAH